MTESMPTHLILVCCHAIYIGGSTRGLNEQEWLLAAFQHGEIPTFVEHIQAALRLLVSDPSSILVFSGSKTRREIDKSEARSYLDLCIDNTFWHLLDKGDDGRILLEEQALDSFGNLTFGLLSFWKRTRTWPGKCSIVSHEFKRRRFLDLHIQALGYPRENVAFVGIDPSYMMVGSAYFNDQKREMVVRGEMERGFRPWEKDPCGKEELLRAKRVGRNPWGVSQLWFVNEDDRKESGVRSAFNNYEHRDSRRGVIEVTEEVPADEGQPWQAK